MILEICVDDVAGLEAAVSGGADRIEALCGAVGRRCDAIGGFHATRGVLWAAGERHDQAARR